MEKLLSIHAIPSLQDNYIWAIVDAQHKKACIVDPGEVEPVEAFLSEQQLSLQAILITHHHWDHTNGVPGLKNKYQVPVYGSATSKNSEITCGLIENARVPTEVCPLGLSVLTIPGHTLDHIAYYAPGVLFCGDTLFAAGCGRLFEGSALQMFESLQKMAALPENTQVYCAHEYTEKNLRFAASVEPHNTAIAERLQRIQALRQQQLCSLPSSFHEEKQTNPFLRCQEPSVIAAAEQFAGQTLATAVEVFSTLRKWKDGF